MLDSTEKIVQTKIIMLRRGNSNTAIIRVDHIKQQRSLQHADTTFTKKHISL